MGTSGKPPTGWDGKSRKVHINNWTCPEKLTAPQRITVRRSTSKMRRRSDKWWLEEGLFSWYNEEEIYSPSLCYLFQGHPGYYLLTEDGTYIDPADEAESMGEWVNWALDMNHEGEQEHRRWHEEHKTEGGWKC